MRISDWSSDVCSSDLPGLHAGRAIRTEPLRIAGLAELHLALLPAADRSGAGGGGLGDAQLRPRHLHAPGRRLLAGSAEDRALDRAPRPRPGPATRPPPAG